MKKKSKKKNDHSSHFFLKAFALLALLLALAYLFHRYFRDNSTPDPAPVSAPSNCKGKVLGIDISHHNGNINWRKVKDSGIDFAYIKATEGTTHTNRRFQRNYNLAKEHGLRCGMYHFFSYFKSGKEQADYFLSQLTFEDGDLPPAVDIEYVHSSDRKTAPAIVQQRKRDIAAFDSILYDALGIHPLIYTNAECYRDLIQGTVKGGNDIWICDIIHTTPVFNHPWVIWQYQHDGKVGGIKGNVDLNVFNGTHPQFLSWLNSYK